jgi:aquaporin Z
MLSAAGFTVLIEHPAFGVPDLVASDAARRSLIGLVMGATAVALIYSPWGRRSGAHMNPAVTLTFWRLGRVHAHDAIWFVTAQFAGGVLGVLLALGLFGERFVAAPVSFVTTVPRHGAPLALALETLISCGLMFTVLGFSSRARLAPYTGLAAGALVAFYIAFEAPYSGMSMNPARSFASAVVARDWTDLWIYLVATPLGMLSAAALYKRKSDAQGCAKVVHAVDARCIHCGYRPPPPVAVWEVRNDVA